MWEDYSFGKEANLMATNISTSNSTTECGRLFGLERNSLISDLYAPVAQVVGNEIPDNSTMEHDQEGELKVRNIFSLDGTKTQHHLVPLVKSCFNQKQK